MEQGNPKGTHTRSKTSRHNATLTNPNLSHNDIGTEGTLRQDAALTDPNISHKITLFCLVYGDPINRAFPVKIFSTDTVGDLKKLIQNENPMTFECVDPKDLVLWAVSIPASRDFYLKKIDLSYDACLMSVKKISALFPEKTADECIHIIVMSPEGVVSPFSSRHSSKRKSIGDEWGPRKKALLALQTYLPSPSSYAKKTCMQDNVPINHHRLAGRSDIPVQFYHNIFDSFLEQVENDEGVEQYAETVEQLIPRISELLDTEARRRDIILNFLRYLGLPLEPITSGAMLSDGTLYSSGSRRFLLCNLEVKSDFPTGSSAYIQNAGYYAKFTANFSKKNIDIAGRTCFPSFLVLLEGTYLSINGAVFVDTICIDRLSTVIPLERAAYDRPTLIYTARIFHALVSCVKEMRKHYEVVQNPAVTISKSVSGDSGVFPRIPSDANINLRYIKRLCDNKRLWQAILVEDDKEQEVVVKFVDRYALEVHEFCADNEIAPPLRYHQTLGRGWSVIIMDYLASYRSLFDIHNYSPEVLTSSLHELVCAKLKILHDAGFVHGDMRSPNILLGDDGKVCFVDFDWAGKIGSIKYPASMNPQIAWHPGVGIGKPIEVDHDIYLVNSLFGEHTKESQSALPRSNFCEWDVSE